MLVVELLKRCIDELREPALAAFSRRGRHVRMSLSPPLHGQALECGRGAFAEYYFSARPGTDLDLFAVLGEPPNLFRFLCEVVHNVRPIRADDDVLSCGAAVPPCGEGGCRRGIGKVVGLSFDQRCECSERFGRSVVGNYEDGVASAPDPHPRCECRTIPRCRLARIEPARVARESGGRCGILGCSRDAVEPLRVGVRIRGANGDLASIEFVVIEFGEVLDAAGFHAAGERVVGAEEASEYHSFDGRCGPGPEFDPARPCDTERGEFPPQPVPLLLGIADVAEARGAGAVALDVALPAFRFCRRVALAEGEVDGVGAAAGGPVEVYATHGAAATAPVVPGEPGPRDPHAARPFRSFMRPGVAQRLAHRPQGARAGLSCLARERSLEVRDFAFDAGALLGHQVQVRADYGSECAAGGSRPQGSRWCVLVERWAYWSVKLGVPRSCPMVRRRRRRRSRTTRRRES